MLDILTHYTLEKNCVLSKPGGVSNYISLQISVVSRERQIVTQLNLLQNELCIR